MKAEQAVLNHYHDYPDAESGSFKRMRLDDAPSDNPRSKKVLEVKKEVAKQERSKVREQEELKRIRENQEAQRLLKQQIEDKRRQIEQLQVQRKLAEEEQVKSYELAKFKEQEERDRQKRKQDQVAQNEKAAKERADVAFKRMLAEKEVIEAKERQAAYRRKVIQEAQREERNKAAQRQEILNAKKPETEEKVEFDKFHRPLGRVNYNRNVDYTKTCLHNPILVRNVDPEESDQPIQTAIDKAREAQQRIRVRRQQREESEEKYRQASEERGRQALRKIADQRILEQKARQSEEQLRQYNMEKVEQGKRDQYLGLKPTTLTQMEINKKLRSEREFEQMFFKDKKLQWVNEPATRYQIAQNRSQQERMSSSGGSWSKSQAIRKTSRKSVEESRIPNESGSKYSFQDENMMTVTEGSADRSNIARTNYPIQEENESQEETSRQAEPAGKPDSESFARTRAQRYERPQRFPGNYPEYSDQSPSQSPPQKKELNGTTSNKLAEREQIKEFIRQNEQYLANAQKQRRVVYKDNKDNGENSREQQNSRKSPPEDQKLVDRFIRSAKEQEPKRPHLSNICQDRQPQHSDLDYSQDSEHEQQ